jgi:transcriptional regulator with XRE-family HTH domain
MLKTWMPTIDTEFIEETTLAMAQATIDNAIRAAGLSRAELARSMGRPRSFVTRILRGDHNLTVRTLARALAACGYQLNFTYSPIGVAWSTAGQATERRVSSESSEGSFDLAA